MATYTVGEVHPEVVMRLLDDGNRIRVCVADSPETAHHISAALNEYSINHQTQETLSDNMEQLRQYSGDHRFKNVRVFKDGNKWCALCGENLQEGESGWGDTPDEAADDLAPDSYVVDTYLCPTHPLNRETA